MKQDNSINKQTFTINDSSLSSEAISNLFGVSKQKVWNMGSGRTKLDDALKASLIRIERAIKKEASLYYSTHQQ